MNVTLILPYVKGPMIENLVRTGATLTSSCLPEALPGITTLAITFAQTEKISILQTVATYEVICNFDV